MIILAATPIGNLGDVSRRLVDALSTVEVVAAEDTRSVIRLLSALGIAHRPQLIPLHEHNEKDRAAALVSRAAATDVLLVTDAGTPTVSDPGFVVVVEAIAQGVPVTVLPGPSAVIAALAVSGLPTDRFAFEGFLPRRPGPRRAALAALAREPRTMVIFESPVRTAATLADMAAAFGPRRRAVVCRELTKAHEEVRRGTLVDLTAWAGTGVRGEVVIVVAGAEPIAVALADAVHAVQEEMAAGERLKDAAAAVAEATGHSSRDLYRAALAERGGSGEGEADRDGPPRIVG